MRRKRIRIGMSESDRQSSCSVLPKKGIMSCTQSAPYKFGEINHYDNELNLKNVIRNVGLEKMDEALNICDLTKLTEKFHNWKQVLPRVQPYYAIKCNDDPFIVKILAELGTGFDCASKNEIKQVLDIGVEPERIIFANPCKPVSHLEYAKEQNIKTSTVDTEFEIYKIFEHYPDSNLIIRFRCEAKDVQCPLGDKFGCDSENDATALILLAKTLGLRVTGVSFHVGSGCKSDFQAYDRAITTAGNIFKFGKMLGYDMNIVDIGGGFPGSDDKKFTTIGNIINKSLDRHFPDQKIKIISEPGRYFVAAAYTLICKIHAKREVRIAGKLSTKMYYVNDGVYGLFNCILYDHQEVKPQPLLDVDNVENLPTFKSLIWGPTCDALDKIIDNIYLPNLSCGDYIAFPDMGAYTIPVASPFNGFTLPRTLHFLKSKS